MFKLQVGKYYKSRAGDVVKIEGLSQYENWPYLGDNGKTYTTYGSQSNDRTTTEYDLLSEASESELVSTRAYEEVNHPSHYTQGGIECIDAIQAQLTPEEFRGFLKGNVAKYLWREREKQGNVSLEKAQWYLNKLIQETE